MHIYGIAIKHKPGASMKEVDSARVTLEAGLEGDCRGKGDPNRTRQVTLLSLQQWQDACQEVHKELPWDMRRAGLCVDGITFGPEDVGRRLIIGAVGSRVILEITSQTKPCMYMDRIRPGLAAALTPDWRGGVCCRVIKSGVIEVNSPVARLTRK